MDFTLPSFMQDDALKALTDKAETAEVTSIRPDLPAVPEEVPKLLPAVRSTIEALPWRTKQDDAAVALAMQLAQRLDYVIERTSFGANIPTYKATEQRFANSAIREIGELLLRTLMELGASPAARANLKVPTGGESARANPIAARREAHRQNRA